MADLASIAAATSAGYKEIVTQRGSIFNVVLEKVLTGPARHDISVIRSHGEGSTQAAAETVALAAINHQRDDRQRRTGGAVDVT